MRKELLLLFICLMPFLSSAQITGKVTNTAGEGLPFVNVYVKDAQRGTTSNADGIYQLNLENAAEYILVFQFLGYSSQTITLNPKQFPYTLNVTLKEETTSLDEVVVDASVNPADRIIRAVIANKKNITAKQENYTADFYSRGLWKIKNAPKRILGQEINLGGGLDSTRSGIVYLSETLSKIAVSAPNDFKETITASKVSGDDQGFSFNSAQEANFSFYNNTLEINAPLVSPIADNAFGYYSYKLVGNFYEGSALINKIEVIPKRENDRVFSGFIYIVDDLWQLYGAELSTTGAAIQVPFIEKLQFKHNFKYIEREKLWVKISQTIDFGFKMLSFGGDGRFTAVYSNYDFQPGFTKKSFTNEVLSFADGANKKDSLFWQGTRPVPLTNEESTDYVKKDSLQSIQKSEKYLDSVDAERNKFRLLDPLLGYDYTNTHDRWNVSLASPLAGIRFNTVQGWNSAVALSYASWTENYERVFNANLSATYGLADEQLRFTGGISKRFNRTNNRTLWLRGGREVKQFNASEPISTLINSVSTLFWERNYMKVYDLSSAQLGYSEEIFNGVQLQANLNYEKREPLINNTDYVLIKNSVDYTSNNPLAPDNSNTPAIDKHEIAKLNIGARVHFDQKYLSYPDGKFNVNESAYPTLSLAVEQGFAASSGVLNFTQFRAGLAQEITVRSKGTFSFEVRGGAFLNAQGISFVDYQHFDGNQTRVNFDNNGLAHFNLLPYYQFSTNKSYVEGHIEHDFKGFILGKIPGIRALNLNLIAGAKALSTQTNKPYSELSLGLGNLGFGKFRFLRVDYVRSFYNGGSDGAFVFGVSF